MSNIYHKISTFREGKRGRDPTGISGAVKKGSDSVSSGVNKGVDAVSSGVNKGVDVVSSGVNKGVDVVSSGVNQGINFVVDEATQIDDKILQAVPLPLLVQNVFQEMNVSIVRFKNDINNLLLFMSEYQPGIKLYQNNYNNITDDPIGSEEEANQQTEVRHTRKSPLHNKQNKKQNKFRLGNN